MTTLLIAFFLALIPFVAVNGFGDGIRTPKEVASILALIVIIGVGFKDIKPIRNMWLFAFLGWCYLTTILNQFLIPVYLSKVILKVPVTMFAWQDLFYITLGVISIMVIASSNPTSITFNKLPFNLEIKSLSFKDEIKCIASVINLAVIVTCCYAILQALGLDNLFRTASSDGSWVASNPFAGHFHHRIVGMIGNPTILASWLVICLPFSLYLRNRLGVIGAILSFAIICLTNSITCIAISIIGILFYFLFSNKRKALLVSILSLILIIAISYLIIPKTELQGFLNPAGRLEVHKEAWNILQNRPLFGMGIGSFEQLVGLNPEIVNKLGDENWRQLHDEYGQVWFETGLIGLMLVMGFILSIVRRFFKFINQESVVLMTSFVSLLLVSLVLFPLRVGPTSIYAVVITALLLKSQKEIV